MRIAEQGLAAWTGATPPKVAPQDLRLGDGNKRFFNTVPRRTLALVDSVTFPTGVVVHTYRPAP